MGFFDGLKLKLLSFDNTDEKLYEIVHGEMEAGVLVPGLWAKAVAESHGNENLAVSLYIKYRAVSLFKELSDESRNVVELKHDPLHEKALQAEREADRQRARKVEHDAELQKARNMALLTQEDQDLIKPYLSVIKNRFVININTITDKNTKLIWSRNADLAERAIKFSGALKLADECNRNSFGSKSKWVIPDKWSVSTIFDTGKKAGIKDQLALLCYIGFVNVRVPYYHWLSSNDDKRSHGSSFSARSGNPMPFSDEHHVWLVSKR